MGANGVDERRRLRCDAAVVKRARAAKIARANAIALVLPMVDHVKKRVIDSAASKGYALRLSPR